MSEMLLPDKVDAIMADTKKIYFFGEIRYRDAFGEARTTSVRHETFGEDLTKEGLFAISGGGNSAT